MADATVKAVKELLDDFKSDFTLKLQAQDDARKKDFREMEARFGSVHLGGGQRADDGDDDDDEAFAGDNAFEDDVGDDTLSQETPLDPRTWFTFSESQRHAAISDIKDMYKKLSDSKDRRRQALTTEVFQTIKALMEVAAQAPQLLTSKAFHNAARIPIVRLETEELLEDGAGADQASKLCESATGARKPKFITSAQKTLRDYNATKLASQALQNRNRRGGGGGRGGGGAGKKNEGGGGPQKQDPKKGSKNEG